MKALMNFKYISGLIALKYLIQSFHIYFFHICKVAGGFSCTMKML